MTQPPGPELMENGLALILNLNNDNPEFRKMLPLRPLFFALENRAQITKLIETLKRLSAATENAYSAKYLWKK